MATLKKTLLLTGASRGIGHATVKHFHAAEWRVITVSRQPFDKICPWPQGEKDHVQMDLNDLAGYPAAIAQIKEKLAAPETGGKLSALVNNAGMSPKVDGKGMGVLATDLSVWQNVFNVNLFSTALLARGLFEELKAAQGSVVNVTSIAGGKVLKDLIDGGTMPKGVDYGVMDGAMNKGEVAMVINGPWAWANLKTSKINFGVAPVPSVNGKPSPSFLGVYSAAINAASKNKDLSIELIENFMLTDEGLAAWNGKSDLGALADTSAAAAQTDPNVQATLVNAGAGIPMPSNPEMGAFWSAMGPALANITTGAQSVEDSLNDAAKRILAGK